MMASAQDDPRHAGTIWAIDLHQPRPAPQPQVPAEFRQLGPASLESLSAAMGVSSHAEILRRLNSGERCYTAWVDGQLASYGWVSFDEEFIGELNLRLRLVPGEAYVWDCFTLPAFRRQGLYGALLAHILLELEKDAVCRVWIGADADNAISQRGIARAGFRPAADLVLARVFAMRLVWVQGRSGVPEAVVSEARRAFLDNRDSVWLKAVELLKSTAQPDLQSAPSSTHPETAVPEQPLPSNAPSAGPDAAASPSAVH